MKRLYRKADRFYCHGRMPERPGHHRREEHYIEEAISRRR